MFPLTARPRLVRALGVVGWYGALPLLRLHARRREGRLVRGGVTVVTVNWNSWDHLAVLIEVVRRRSPSGTRILVVDNGSRDGSRPRLAADRSVDSILLPANLGHDLALDLGVLACCTEFAVTLDVDAFPLHDRWLQVLLAPLDRGAQISGARLNRQYVHPCCLALRTMRFVSKGHSFRQHYQPEEGREPYGEVGEEMSAREAPNLHFFDPTSQRGPADVGTVFGDLVYHNFYATRFRASPGPVLDHVVGAHDSHRAWQEAIERYVP
jgi:glycosyltransferase involved in cell wall biosynthesis